jgi:septum formation protein
MISLSHKLILASNSPRRKQLLQEAGFQFEVKVIPTDESYPEDLDPLQVAAYISEIKVAQFTDTHEEDIILTADTVVVVDNKIMGKPKDKTEALAMIRLLSGRTHQVVTAISLKKNNDIQTISDIATVYFSDLSSEEINYYVDHYAPYDKAGSYGIQEWIGMIGISKIEGSFYTIMGLPIHRVYQLLKPWIHF